MAGAELLDVVRKRNDGIGIDCHTLTFNPEASENIIFPHISGRINNIDKGSGVLVLIDSDATHKSLFEQLSQLPNVVCVTGFNDAMINALKFCQNKSLDEASDIVIEAAKDSIRSV